MEALLTQAEEEKKQKTPQQRLREKCRSNKNKKLPNVHDVHRLQQLAKNPNTRKIKKEAAQRLSPDEYLMLQQFWDKDKQKKDAQETVRATHVNLQQQEQEPTQMVVDAVTGKSRPTCVVHFTPLQLKS